MNFESNGVTAVISAHTSDISIWRAIKSVVSQSIRPKQIIVVTNQHDGEIDFIANEFGCELIKVKHRSTPGVVRNAGLHAATQPWTAFLDASDDWTPGHIERVMPYLRSYQLIGEAALIPPDGGTPPEFTGNTSRIGESLLLPFDVVKPGRNIATSAAVVHTKTAIAAGSFAETGPAEEVDLWMRMIDHGKGIALSSVGAICHGWNAHRSYNRQWATLARVNSYSDRPWLWHEYRKTFMVQQHFDSLGHAIRHDRPVTALRSIAYLLSHLHRLGSIRQQLQHNRKARRRARNEWKRLERQVTDVRDVSSIQAADA